MKKKGFTLIELLAVIVVLAIIALIATPIVLNLINNAKEGAAKSSATAYVKAVENGVVQELVKNSNGKYTGKFKVDSTGLKLVSDTDNNVKITVDVSGKLPKENSYVVLGENGTVVSAYFTIDSYNVQYSDGVANIVKESNNGPTKVEPTSTDTHKGIVYLDPTNLENSCNASNSVSETGTKTGCMKWYIYSEDDNNYNMILDHNTTADVVWNSASFEREMEDAKIALENDTSSWDKSLKVRLITANEVAKITGNTNFDEATSTTESWFRLDSNNRTEVANSTNKSKYAWLYDYTDDCEKYGCNIEDSSTWGYWTSTHLAGETGEEAYMVWLIAGDGTLGNNAASMVHYGVRPVITISKSIIS